MGVSMITELGSIIAGDISLMGYWVPSSASCGEVDSLSEYLNGGHVFTC